MLGLWNEPQTFLTSQSSSLNTKLIQIKSIIRLHLDPFALASLMEQQLSKPDYTHNGQSKKIFACTRLSHVIMLTSGVYKPFLVWCLWSSRKASGTPRWGQIVATEGKDSPSAAQFIWFFKQTLTMICKGCLKMSLCLNSLFYFFYWHHHSSNVLNSWMKKKMLVHVSICFIYSVLKHIFVYILCFFCLFCFFIIKQLLGFTRRIWCGVSPVTTDIVMQHFRFLRLCVKFS